MNVQNTGRKVKVIKTREEMSAAIKERRDIAPRVGDFLLGKGLISSSMLQAAIAAQSQGGSARLGDILVSMGAVTRDDLEDALSHVSGAVVLDVSQYPSPKSSTGLIPDAAIQMYKGYPLDEFSGTIVAAFLDKPSTDQLAALRFATGMRVFPVEVSDPNALKHLFARYFPSTKTAHMRHSVLDKSRYSALSSSRESPAGRFKHLAAMAISSGASDLHIRPINALESQAMLRIDGTFQDIEVVSKQDAFSIVRHIEVMAGIDFLKKHKKREGRLSFDFESRIVDFRISVIEGIHGDSAVLRVLDPGRIPSALTDLRLPGIAHNALLSIIKRPHGMLLVTGPTGSGKSTTMYTLIKELYSKGHHVVTVEDPVECKIPGINQFEGNVELLLEQLLRHDPDVIMLGELRGQHSTTMAMNAALTGHLVLSTIHANDGPTTIHRLLGLGASPTALSGALSGIMSQRLVRLTCLTCAGEGCSVCAGTGYKGRVMIAEVARPKASFVEISKHPSYEEAAHHLEFEGGVTLEKELIALAQSGKTTWDEAECLTTKKLDRNPQKKAPDESGANEVLRGLNS